MRETFTPTGVYLDSATYGLPPREALAALAQVTAEWAAGTYDPTRCDVVIAGARASFARLHRVAVSDVAIGHQVSPLAGMVAGALPRGARVLAATGDFTSLLFPFLTAGCRVRTVALEQLAEAIDAGTEAVAVSAVQSADGRLADLEAIATAAERYGAMTIIDATQASGWLALDASRFDVVVCGGYKWLCHPRGTALMTIRAPVRDRVSANSANWYATESPWESCYGTPLRQAPDARRFDVSPAWFSWHAAHAALTLLETTGIDQIHRHDLALANRLRDGLELPAGDTPIVSLTVPEAGVRALARASVRCSIRAGRVRLSAHLYNTEADIDRALEALTTAG